MVTAAPTFLKGQRVVCSQLGWKAGFQRHPGQRGTVMQSCRINTVCVRWDDRKSTARYGIEFIELFQQGFHAGLRRWEG